MAKELKKFNIDNLSFKFDENLKKDYLKLKPLDTAKAEYPTFVAVDEYEELLNKPVYNFSLAERDELLMMKFKNSTIGAVMSTISRIKGYIDFCIQKGVVVHMQNVFDTLTKSEAKRFVSKQATEFRYISPTQLKEYQNMLVNNQDKLLLELPYVGVRGRTVRGGTLEEIINLQIDPKSQNTKDCILELVRNDGTMRELTVSQETMDLILKTYNDTEYLSNNGIGEEDGTDSRKYKINRYGNYVLCAVGNTKCDKLNPVVINARMQRIQSWCGNEFITIHNLYMSGMISMAIDMYNKKGELTKDDYIDICKRYKYGDENPERYYLKIKDDVEIYLKNMKDGVMNA